MKHPVVRIAAVVFAASLMSAFVVFKSGACAKSRPAMPASRVFFPGTMPTTAPGTMSVSDEFKTFAGSKSGLVITGKEFPPLPENPLQPPERPETRVMGGSKSLAPLFPSGDIRKPATTPSTQP